MGNASARCHGLINPETSHIILVAFFINEIDMYFFLCDCSHFETKSHHTSWPNVQICIYFINLLRRSANWQILISK